MIFTLYSRSLKAPKSQLGFDLYNIPSTDGRTLQFQTQINVLINHSDLGNVGSSVGLGNRMYYKMASSELGAGEMVKGGRPMITFRRYAKSETRVGLDGRIQRIENGEGKRRRIREAAEKYERISTRDLHQSSHGQKVHRMVDD